MDLMGGEMFGPSSTLAMVGLVHHKSFRNSSRYFRMFQDFTWWLPSSLKQIKIKIFKIKVANLGFKLLNLIERSAFKLPNYNGVRIVGLKSNIININFTSCIKCLATLIRQSFILHGTMREGPLQTRPRHDYVGFV